MALDQSNIWLDNWQEWDKISFRLFAHLPVGTRSKSLKNPLELENTYIEATPENTGAVLECLNQRFVPCGIDRQLGPNGRPVLMLGKLNGKP